ncbi:MAG: hypothetical protein KDC46_03890, partial [Thermoleophilia bacterium]|nr:hypothetical protein [Thermoleophilia bacterium]
EGVLASGGFAYGDTGRAASAQSQYPPGFHLVAAALSRSFDDTAGSTDFRGTPADAMWLMTMLAFGAMGAVLGLLVIQFAAGDGTGVRWVVALTSALASAGAIFWHPLSLLVYAFVPQIVSLLLLATLLLALMMRPALGVGQTLLVAASCIALIGWTWFFLLPVASISVLAWLRIDRVALRGRWMSVAFAAVASLATVPIPIYFLLRGADTSVVNVAGGVVLLPAEAVYGVAALGLLALLTITSSTDAQQRSGVLLAAFLTSSIAFSLLLGMYQQATIGTTEYFYAKSLYTIVVLSIVVVLGVAGRMLSSARIRPARRVGGAMLLSVGLVLLTSMRPWDRAASPIWGFRDGGGMTQLLRPSFDAYVRAHDRIRGRYVIQWERTDQPVHDYIASRWLTTLNGKADGEVWELWYKTSVDQHRGALADFITATNGNVAVLTGNESLAAEMRGSSVDPQALERVEWIK